ncbi:MAG: hypothetical protein ACTSR8_08765 [Promethearchaeota archaeon]
MRKQILLSLLVLTIISTTLSSNSFENAKHNKANDIQTKTPKFAAENFDLIRDLEASSYFISPESSPGNKDGVYFSFTANRNGNYTLNVKNFPFSLTYNTFYEFEPSFDNPNGTNLYYISFIDFGVEDFDGINIKLAISENAGRSWNIKTIANIYFPGTEITKAFTFVRTTALAANPRTGVIGMIALYNLSELVYIGSTDNGTTWSDFRTISTANTLGCTNLIDPKGEFPNTEFAILKNGTMIAMIESDSQNTAGLMYCESYNNGTDWTAPKNVSILEGMKCRKPKIQVNYESGNFLLSWINKGALNNISWASFNSSQNFSSNVTLKKVTDYQDGNYDFIYNKKKEQYEFILINSTQITKFNTSDYSISLTEKSLGYIDDLNDNLNGQSIYLNTVFDGITYQFFFIEDFTGPTDLYQYFYLSNATLWSKKDNFTANELEQLIWNGKLWDGGEIKAPRVKIDFTAHNGSSNEIKRTMYINIDNTKPSFKTFDQKLYYFNPQSSNINYTNILWDLLPSEECNLQLKVFQLEKNLGQTIKVTDNAWEELYPKIFISNTGDLYTVYLSLEAGRTVIYLKKSSDYGITWSNPIEIYQTIADYTRIEFIGAAWNSVVAILVKDADDSHHYLYRSFDNCETFETPINISNIDILPTNYESISDMLFTKNGDLYMTLCTSRSPFFYYVYRSSDIGINWEIMGSRKEYNNFTAYRQDIGPDLSYDSENNILYLLLPAVNYSYMVPEWNVGNFTILTYNTLLETWISINSTGYFQLSKYTTQPHILLSRETSYSEINARIILQKSFTLNEGKIERQFIEFNSSDKGKHWFGPYNSTIYSPIFDSDYDETFYLDVYTDGADREIIFNREGRLIRTKSSTITTQNITEYSYDGKDDFGNYLESGLYLYLLKLYDDAGNFASRSLWMYADYDTPQISNLKTNWTIDPIPSYDVNITVNITDDTGFTAYLYYKKDNNIWQFVQMTNLASSIYSAIIPGDTITEEVSYYIKAIDVAGNEVDLDNNDIYYIYDLPDFKWDSSDLFKDGKKYVSDKDYKISITIEKDLDYVDQIIFRYSYDEGETWVDLELKQNSPEFTGTLKKIPADLRELQYQIILIDIFGNEIELTQIEKVEFYPEIPSPELDAVIMSIVIIVAALVGFSVAYGYIKLKTTSHDALYQQIFKKEYLKSKDKSESIEDLTLSERKQKTKSEDIHIASSFTKAYIVSLCGMLIFFALAFIFSPINPQFGIILLAASLLLSVFGYTILFSRDISINIYLEKINRGNVALETFQIIFMGFNLVMILIVGYSIDWFRYYLIESTFNFGDLSIPRLYLSVIGVFFTSLVLVAITTYIQLFKVVKSLRTQRKQGASENLLLYLKDENSSRLITRLGYKTILFLVTVLVGIITTTNLLTPETSILLLIVLIPFVLAGVSALLLHRVFDRKKEPKRKTDLQIPFIDSEKKCNKCGAFAYLTDKYCGSCASQLIFAQKIGTYTSRCTNCNSLINDQAKYCTQCGKSIETDEKL